AGPTAKADDVGVSKMEIGAEPCVWHKLSLKIDVHYVALSTSNGQERKLDTRVGMNPGRGRSRVNEFTPATNTCSRAERIPRRPREDPRADLGNRRTPWSSRQPPGCRLLCVREVRFGSYLLDSSDELSETS